MLPRQDISHFGHNQTEDIRHHTLSSHSCDSRCQPPGDRLLHTTERPAYLAKNRFGLSDTLELAWPTLAAGIPFYTGAAADAGTSPTTTTITQGA